jgi:DMSO/TMAO reductase YedYZ molybdopterin-dependent catalytic subunit
MYRRSHVPLLVAALLAVLALSACGRSPSRTASESTSTPSEEVTAPVTLPSVEVTSYRGQPLSRISDLQENSIKGPQRVDRERFRLKIDGLVTKPAELTYAQITAMKPSYRKAVTLNCVEGWSVTLLWEGVRVRDLLQRAGGPSTGAKIVVFHAADGYTSSLPLDYFYKRDILIAYKENGVALTDEWGWPLQLVAEDHWGYKWVKWIERIEVSSDALFRGYWESRGYSSGGELDKPYFGR